MRSKLLACLVTSVGISGVVAPPLSACGDKFLALGRNMSLHQRYASVYPGAIAIYTRDPAGAAKAMETLHKILTRAGHRVSFVGPLVKPSGVDLVLASAAESDAVRALIGAEQMQPTVLYVASGGRLKSAVTPVIKDNDKPETFLKAIDREMKARKTGVKVKP